MLTNRKMQLLRTKREGASASVYLRHAGKPAQSISTFAGCPTNLDWEVAGP